MEELLFAFDLRNAAHMKRYNGILRIKNSIIKMGQIGAFIIIFASILFLSGCSGGEGNSDILQDEPSAVISNTSGNYEGELTLDFSFGKRDGFYSGEIDDNGLPNGQGKFASKNTTGESWTYEGDWVAGHWDGFGVSTWASGTTYIGEYKSDVQMGHGEMLFPDGSRFEGEFSNDSTANGTFYSRGGYNYSANIENGVLIKKISDLGSDLFESVYLQYATRERSFFFEDVKKDIVDFAEVNGFEIDVKDATSDDLGAITLYDSNEDFVYFAFSFLGELDVQHISIVSYFQSTSNSEVSLSNLSTYGDIEYDKYFVHVIGKQEEQVSGVDDQREFLFYSLDEE